MGLRNSLLSAIMNPAGRAPLAGGAGTSGGLADGLGGLVDQVASNPQLLQVITGMLSSTGGEAGLGGLIGKFQRAGLGDAVASWVGGGPNLSAPIR